MGYAVPAPRLVATDLDGTLLRSDGTVSERTRRALVEIERAGLEVVIVTARPPRWMDEMGDLVGEHGIALCGNGAFVYDVRARTVLEEKPLDDELVAELVGELRQAVPGVCFAAERRTGPYAEPHYPQTPPPGAAPGQVPVGPIEARDPAPVGKLLARAPHWDPVRFLAIVETVVGARAHLGYSGAQGLAEITGPGVTKAAALTAWVAERGVHPDGVWAFGDMPNDLPMLRWAGRSFAVANADARVLAEVDEVCGGNDEDGVAGVLEGLLARLAPR